VILSPSAWAVAADFDPDDQPYGQIWIDAYTRLARLYEIPVAGVSNVGSIDAGPWAGRKCIGCSLAVDRNANILVQASYGEQAEELRVVELQLTPRRATGTRIAEMLRDKGYGCE
jgi:hypothetical protein